MALAIESVDHVQITVPPSAAEQALAFYRTVLGLEQIEKPDALLKNGGAWYRAGSIEIHVSIEDGTSGTSESKRHVSYVVPDLAAAESELTRHGVTIFRDRQPIPGWRRFYIRDPGGNRIEIAERTR